MTIANEPKLLYSPCRPLRAQMIGPNFRDIHVLCRIHKAGPKQYIEPNEEYSGRQTGLIGAAEIGTFKSTLEDQAQSTAYGSD